MNIVLSTALLSFFLQIFFLPMIIYVPSLAFNQGELNGGVLKISSNFYIFFVMI